MLGTARVQREENARSQPTEKLQQSSEVSYNEWKSLAKRKGAEASIVWEREAQVGADSCDEDMDNR